MRSTLWLGMLAPMQVTVIGAGYVGLATAVGLASIGHRVRVGERDPERLAALQAGVSPIYEPDMDALLRRGLESGSLSFHASNVEVVADADVVFLAVPTPEGDGGAADTRIVEAVIDEIASSLVSGALVVMKSTVPVGSVARFQRRLEALGASATVLSNPEFLREGSAVADFLHPDRVVIGTRDQRAAEVMIELYRPLQAPVVVTDPVSSEMVKYAANAYLATRITFANAIANLCESVGADVKDVLLGMGYDRRIGFHFLNPGPGFGGSCFPKDTKALVAVAEGAGYDFSLLKGVIEVNELQAEHIAERVADGRDLESRVVGLWGMAFKAGTDDTRESPALKIARSLVSAGAVVRAYDPEAKVRENGLTIVESAIEAVDGADVLLIATEWPEFQAIDLGEVKAVMEGDLIVDARNLLDPAAVRRLGLRYVGVGR